MKPRRKEVARLAGVELEQVESVSDEELHQFHTDKIEMVVQALFCTGTNLRLSGEWESGITSIM